MRIWCPTSSSVPNNRPHLGGITGGSITFAPTISNKKPRGARLAQAPENISTAHRESMDGPSDRSMVAGWPSHFRDPSVTCNAWLGPPARRWITCFAGHLDDWGSIASVGSFLLAISPWSDWGVIDRSIAGQIAGRMLHLEACSGSNRRRAVESARPRWVERTTACTRPNKLYDSHALYAHVLPQYARSTPSPSSGR